MVHMKKKKKKTQLRKKTKESLRMGPCVKSAFSRETEPIGYTHTNTHTHTDSLQEIDLHGYFVVVQSLSGA